MLSNHPHPVFSGIVDLCVDPVDVNFPRHLLFGCFFLLLLDHHTFLLYNCLPLWIMLLGVQKSSISWTLVETGGQNESFAAIVCHFLVNDKFGGIFTKY